MGKKESKKKGGGGGDGGKKDEKSITVVLKVYMYCEGCVKKVKKSVWEFKGVDGVDTDSEKNLVTVRGTMDTEGLIFHLKKKLKRDVEVVPSKKDKAGGGDKKSGKKGDGGGEDGKAEPNWMGVNMPVYYIPRYAVEYVPVHCIPGSAVEYVHAPQIFSDENPNSCSVM